MTGKDGHCYDVMYTKDNVRRTVEIPYNNFLLKIVKWWASAYYKDVKVYPRWKNKR